MKVKVIQIPDPNTKVPIDNEEHKIDRIKSELANCQPQAEFCEVEVMDMWQDMPDS